MILIYLDILKSIFVLLISWFNLDLIKKNYTNSIQSPKNYYKFGVTGLNMIVRVTQKRENQIIIPLTKRQEEVDIKKYHTWNKRDEEGVSTH